MMKYAVVSFHSECLDSGVVVAPGTEISIETISDYTQVLIDEGILVPVIEQPETPEVEGTSE